jgi:YidC/Oxa1 family membrane protein insertase
LFHLFLTQGGGILGPIIKGLGWILNAIYEFLSIFGIENVGLTIILFTFIVKTAMIPLTIKQQKYTKMSSIMNPEITKIQNKYKGKKDEATMQKQQAELQAVYQKYGSSPTAGCLPMLIQLPIMFALYRVIYKIPAYINQIKGLYTTIAEGIRNIEGYAPKLVEYAKDVNVRVSGFEEFEASGTLTIDHIIDILSNFNSETWNKLATVDFPSISEMIKSTSDNIIRINSIPGGLNMLESPGLAFPGILIPILAASLQFIQTKQMGVTNNANNSDNPAGSSMAMMNKVMPIMSGVFCIMLPTGVGLYWVANSAFTILQQFFINRQMDKVDINDLIEKNVEKRKKKLEKKGINPNQSFQDYAKKQTKSIDSSMKTKVSSQENVYVNKKPSNAGKGNYKKNYSSHSAGSISANANLLKNSKGDKGGK